VSTDKCSNELVAYYLLISLPMPNSNIEPDRAPAEIITDVNQLSPEHFKDAFEKLYDKKASEIYLVFSKDKTQHFRSPGQKKPWTTKIYKHADRVAVESGGVVVTLEFAIKTMFNQLIAKN
jgi:hypothetical protein